MLPGSIGRIRVARWKVLLLAGVDRDDPPSDDDVDGVLELLFARSQKVVARRPKDLKEERLMEEEEEEEEVKAEGV